MQRELSFFSIGENHESYNGTSSYLMRKYGFHEVQNPELADVLVFNGGRDIGTIIYGEKPMARGIPYERSQRDDYEIGLFNEFKGKAFMFGICRGAQLLNCLNGGSLWQHVTDHQIDHDMIDLTTGKVMKVTSTHHQMMRPNPRTAEIIGVSNRANSKYAEDSSTIMTTRPKDIKHGEDIEVVWYPNTRSLCIQGHPEYVPNSEFSDWSIDLVRDKYELGLNKKAG